MDKLLSILSIVGPLISELSGVLAKAIEANATNDQATLDDLHTQAYAMADALRPVGQ